MEVKDVKEMVCDGIIVKNAELVNLDVASEEYSKGAKSLAAIMHEVNEAEKIEVEKEKMETEKKKHKIDIGVNIVKTAAGLGLSLTMLFFGLMQEERGPVSNMPGRKAYNNLLDAFERMK